jgi:predicted nuclease of restriction endonuclease-like (RecB) superfamily
MNPSSANSYQDVLIRLKEKIRQARYKAVHTLNSQLLSLYWEIGKAILEQQNSEGWGSKVIDRLATDLRNEFPDMRGISPRNFKYMRSFAEAYPQFGQHLAAQLQSGEDQANIIVQVPLAQFAAMPVNENVQGLLAHLSWYHHITLLEKVKDAAARFFYIRETIINGWSRDVMVHHIEGSLHDRIGRLSNNFQATIAPGQSELVKQVFKDPYKFDFIYLGKEAKERDLEDALTNQLTKFLLELGQGFAFMGRQYRITLGDKEYFFDLLFYHPRLKRYIVVDLKINDFKPEYKGKMEFYLNLSDDHLRNPGDGESVGLILCKTKDGLVAEYALRNSRMPIGIAEYRINEKLPDNIEGELPSIEEIEAVIERGYEELKRPVEKRLDALKLKLSGSSESELQTPASLEIFERIFDEGLVPLFTELLKRLEDFHSLFISHNYFWVGPGNILSLDKLGEHWKNEQYLKQNMQLHFVYSLNGLKKGGVETFDVIIQLAYRISAYWYGFSMVNHNNQQPFFKKLYHQMLTIEDIQSICDTVCNDVIEHIEKRFEFHGRENK